jgi:MFS family permease
MQWGIIIGIFVLSEILQGLADSYPEMEVYLFPLIVLIALLAFSTWVIGPLSDLFLRLNKYGRYALSEREVKVSNLVGIAAAMFALGVILFIPTFNNLFLGLAVYGFTMMVPLSNVYSSSVNAVKLNRYALALAVLGIFGLIEILLTSKMEGMFVMIYLLGFIGYQWAANFWNQGKY